MKEKLETNDARAYYAKRKETVEPVFGIIKSAMGFRRFHLRIVPLRPNGSWWPWLITAAV